MVNECLRVQFEFLHKPDAQAREFRVSLACAPGLCSVERADNLQEVTKAHPPPLLRVLLAPLLAEPLDLVQQSLERQFKTGEHFAARKCAILVQRFASVA